MKTARVVFFFCISLVFIWLAYPTGTQLQSQGILEKVSIERLIDRLEVTLQLTRKTKFNSFSLTERNRLVIDLFQTERFSSSPQIDVNIFGVEKIRTAINRPGVIRVVFDLHDKIPHHKIGEEGNSIKIELWYELKTKQVKPEALAVKKEELEEKKEAEKEVQKIEDVKKEEEKREVEKLEEKKTEAKVKEEPTKVEESKVQQVIPVSKEADELPSPRGLRLEFGLHGGYYMLQSRELKDYFGAATIFTGGEVGVEFPSLRKSAFGFLYSFKIIRLDGQGDYQDTKAEFSNSQMSFTLLFLTEIGRLMPFSGIGLDHNNYRLTYPENHPADHKSGVVWGGNLQVGTNFLLSRKLRIKIVYNYHFAAALQDDFDVILNGNEVIASLSFWFNL